MLTPEKNSFKRAILNERFAFECQDRATLSSSRQLDLCQELGTPILYQLPVTDTACLVSPPVGVCLPFPGHDV